MRRAGGFTLLELLVVIALVAVGTSVLAVAMSRGMAHSQAIEAGRQLGLALRCARTFAITHGEPTTVTFSLAQGRYQACRQPARSLPADMKLRLTTAAQLVAGQQGAIVFYPDGSSTGGNLRLEHNGRAWRIDVAWLTGQVSWQPVQP